MRHLRKEKHHQMEQNIHRMMVPVHFIMAFYHHDWISVVFWISISLVGAIIACLRCESCPLYETICQVWSQTQLFSVSFYNQRLVRKRVLSTYLKTHSQATHDAGLRALKENNNNFLDEDCIDLSIRHINLCFLPNAKGKKLS